MIFVKDLSRFGRNYIEFGQYTDYLFPSLGCRFIALNNGIDTESNNGSTDVMCFLNLINEFYSRDTSKKVKAVKKACADSGFKNAWASMDHQVGPMYQPLRLINRLVAGYDWNDSDVTASLASSRIPILFVHGQQDKLVPYENGPELYNSYQRPKDCFFPEKARHIEAIYTDPEAYAEKIDHMIETYLD